MFKDICVYYNKSTIKNDLHPENHKRINTSIAYLKSKFDTLRIYDHKTIINYLHPETSYEIAKKIICQVYSEEYLDKIKNISEELLDKIRQENEVEV